MRRRRQDQRGYTLFEIMMVVAIIALMASFAIPSLFDARRVADETSAITVVRAMFANQQEFARAGHSTSPVTPYATTLAQLEAKKLLPDGIRVDGEIGRRAGYVFVTGVEDDATSGGGQAMFILAFPEAYGKTGNRSFLVRDDGVIYFKNGPILVAPGDGDPL